MTIVFAENFQYDDELSIVQRYPGSQRPGTTAIPKGWPLRRGPTGSDTTASANSLVLPIEPPTSGRVQIVLDTAFDGNAASSNANCSLHLLSRLPGASGGIEFVGNNTVNLCVRINGNSGMIYLLRTQNHSFRTPVGEVSRWHILYDFDTRLLQVVIDGDLQLHQILPEHPNFGSNVFYRGVGTVNTQSTLFNNTLLSCIVAYDEEPGTLLQNIQFNELPLTVSDAGGWTFSDQGIVEDLDKDNGTDADPYVTASASELELATTEIEGHVNIYAAGSTEGELIELSVDGESADVPAAQGSLPKLVLPGLGPLIRVSALPRGLRPGDYYNGGYYVGVMVNPDTDEMWTLILAPSISVTSSKWKTTNTLTSIEYSLFDGLANTNGLLGAGASLHPAANYCASYALDGFDDYYLMSRDEALLVYHMYKPGTQNNVVGTIDVVAGGGNYNDIPTIPPVERTASIPKQCSVAMFRTGGSEALTTSLTTSNQAYAPNNATAYVDVVTTTGSVRGSGGKANNIQVRPVRREPYFGEI